jgi:hypothetical protein
MGTQRVGLGAAAAGHRGGGVRQQPLDVRLDAEAQDHRYLSFFEESNDRLAGGREAAGAHHVHEILARIEQEDAGGAAEPRIQRLFRFTDDSRALRGVGEAPEHRRAPALLRPAGNDERAQARLAGEVRVDVGRDVRPGGCRRVEHREDRRRLSLLASLHLHA